MGKTEKQKQKSGAPDFALQMEGLRGTAQFQREITKTQQRLGRGLQPATSAQVRQTRATW